MSQRLQGKIAVVTGASRGAGRAIAAVLGEEGATVYVTGRSTTADPAPTDPLPGTIEETAALVTARGGTGIAVSCDHTRDDDVAALFRRVREEQGHLDLLVNNVWGGFERHTQPGFDRPFWEQPTDLWEKMFVAGVRAHFLASRLAVPLMLPRRAGLIVNTVAWSFGDYLGNLYYDVAKAASIRMAYGMAHELRQYEITAVAVAPGPMRTERVAAALAERPAELAELESPEYLGRAVAALAADAHVIHRSGSILTVAELAREYGFTDIDGRRPGPYRVPDLDD